MKDLIFIKLGGGLITDKNKPYTPRPQIINLLAEEIAEVRKKKKVNLLVGHGGGSFPHTSAKKYKTNQGFINKNSKQGFCLVHHDAARLNQIVTEVLIQKGERAFSVSTSSCCLAKNSKVSDFYLKVIKKLLEYKIIPVLFGDSAVDLKKGCSILSTEELFVYLVKKLKPEKIVIADKVKGVYTDDPNRNKRAEFIPYIDKKNWKEVKTYLKESDGIDVTGGMIHKVQKSIELAKLGAPVSIINGKTPNNLKRALLGETLGTSIEWKK